MVIFNEITDLWLIPEMSDSAFLVLWTIIFAFATLFGLYEHRKLSGQLESTKNAYVNQADRLLEANQKLSTAGFVADKARAFLTLVEEGNDDAILLKIAPEEVAAMFRRKDKRWLNDAGKILRFVTDGERKGIGVVSCAFGDKEIARQAAGAYHFQETPSDA